MSKILVTGTAGFIGYHLVNRLIREGHTVTGLDNINDYYDVRLKYDRLADSGIVKDDIIYNKEVISNKYPGYSFIKLDLEDYEAVEELFAGSDFEYVINLAAQAGVRYSIRNPRAYIGSNIAGFANILEACRKQSVRHLVYASSSSVYGLNEKMPFSPDDCTDHPVSLYAASKKSNELMAHTYSHLYGLHATGIRLFTAYGPWGRPDMALYIFTRAISEGKEIMINNKGDMLRDFTYIDDIINALIKVIPKAPEDGSSAPHRIYNLGNNSPVQLMEFIRIIEKELKMKAQKIFLPMQPGDVKATWADISSLNEIIDYYPETPIDEGVRNFVRWYKSYHSVKTHIGESSYL